MHSIPDFLDIAKKINGFKSDRQLARALGITATHQYRTKGVIPDDMTAFKLADLCGLPAHEVLITCHMLKAAAGEHPETHGLWKDVLKMVSNACIVLATLGFLTFSPTQAHAQSGLNYQQAFTQQTTVILIMRRCSIAALLLLLIFLY